MFMIPSKLRKKAREALKGSWGKAALIMLVYFFVTSCISIIANSFPEGTIWYSLAYVIYMLLSIPLAYGLTISFLKLERKEDVKTFDFLYTNFSTAWNVCIQAIAKMIIPIACFFFIALLLTIFVVTKIPMTWFYGIIFVAFYIAALVYFIARGLLYSLSFYIAFDNENLSAKECVEKSEELMMGNRGNLFLLELSFIGWIILGVFTLGIAYLWIFPYIQVSVATFYDEVNTSKTKEVDGSNKIEE